MNDEAFRAWVSAVDETLRKLYLSLSERNYPDSVIAAVLQSATRPYYYFEKEWLEKAEDKTFHGPRETAQDRDNRILGLYKKGAEDTTESESGESDIENAQDTKGVASRTATGIPVHVTGNTRPHKEWLKSFGLRWSPENQWWHGTVNEILTFRRAAEEKNLTVTEAVE